ELAAYAVINVANELMINAIQDITVAEGFNPAEAVLVAGGGAAGINIVPIARELGVDTVIVPRTAGALSAAGMQFSDIVFEESGNCVTLSRSFDCAGVNRVLEDIDARLERARRQLGSLADAATTRAYTVEARY